MGTVKSNSNSQTPKPGDGSERLIFCYLFFWIFNILENFFKNYEINNQFIKSIKVI